MSEPPIRALRALTEQASMLDDGSPAQTLLLFTNLSRLMEATLADLMKLSSDDLFNASNRIFLLNEEEE